MINLRFFVPLLFATLGVAATKPNVLIIYLDDMGWAQPGVYGGKLAPTPHLDSLARNGVRFTNGYVSACVCGPSRVGLMTGRYQARTGHDANGNRAGRELLLTETTMAQRMKAAGYTTGIVGKWHLGDTDERFMPASRGFDYAVGSVGNLNEGSGPAFYRGNQRVANIPNGELTSIAYRDEAVKFIRTNRVQPWFLYLAFNAVHAPHAASAAWLEKFKHLEPRVQRYAAMVAEADESIGRVMAALREASLEENTLVIAMSDNGGASAEAEMGGLRGRKWYVWEGGIRVTWIAQWKGRIPAGQVSAEPVIQLDVLPTALAAASVATRPEWQLDGVNLLPLLERRVPALAPRELYFRFGAQYAVRQGDYKWVKAGKDMAPMLINLAVDPGEKIDLSAQEPERARTFQALYDQWSATMQAPRWEDRRWDGEAARAAQKQDKKEKRKGERKKKEKK